MIVRGSTKPSAFIAAIEGTIARDSHGRKSDEYLTRVSLDDGPEASVIYLAGGYWRAVVIWDAEDRMLGVRLINPDRTPAEIRTVEQGIAILCHFKYQDERITTP